MAPIKNRIARRIRYRKRGWVFTSWDFLDIGTRTLVSLALSRLAKQGMIRRLDRGIYDYPEESKLFGTISPAPEAIAQALACGDRVFPSGAVIANMLGLSTQVPAKPVYLTKATTRTRRVANYTIKLKRARLPLLDNASNNVNLMLQALYYIGKDNIDDIIIARCASILTDCNLADLRCATRLIPRWMADAILKISEKKYENHHLQ